MDPGRRRPSSPSAASPASAPRPGRTPAPRPRCAEPTATQTPAPPTDGTDASPEQPAPQRQNRAQSTALANAHAERWVGSARRECLDRILIVSQRHLERVLHEYVAHHNTHRPHRALSQQPPLPKPIPIPAPPLEARVRRRDRLGGLLHEYELAA